MKWPFGRRSAPSEDSGADAPAAGDPAAPARRAASAPHGQGWRQVAPMAPAFPSMGLVADPGRFESRLTAWQQTGVSHRQMEHVVSADAPSGTFNGSLRTVATPAPTKTVSRSAVGAEPMVAPRPLLAPLVQAPPQQGPVRALEAIDDRPPAPPTGPAPIDGPAPSTAPPTASVPTTSTDPAPAPPTTTAVEPTPITGHDPAPALAPTAPVGEAPAPRRLGLGPPLAHPSTPTGPAPTGVAPTGPTPTGPTPTGSGPGAGTTRAAADPSSPGPSPRVQRALDQRPGPKESAPPAEPASAREPLPNLPGSSAPDAVSVKAVPTPPRRIGLGEPVSLHPNPSSAPAPAHPTAQRQPLAVGPKPSSGPASVGSSGPTAADAGPDAPAPPAPSPAPAEPIPVVSRHIGGHDDEPLETEVQRRATDLAATHGDSGHHAGAGPDHGPDGGGPGSRALAHPATSDHAADRAPTGSAPSPGTQATAAADAAVRPTAPRLTGLVGETVVQRGLLDSALGKVSGLEDRARAAVGQAGSRASGLEGRGRDLLSQARGRAGGLEQQATSMLGQAAPTAGSIEQQARGLLGSAPGLGSLAQGATGLLDRVAPEAQGYEQQASGLLGGALSQAHGLEGQASGAAGSLLSRGRGLEGGAAGALAGLPGLGGLASQGSSALGAAARPLNLPSLPAGLPSGVGDAISGASSGASSAVGGAEGAAGSALGGLMGGASAAAGGLAGAAGGALHSAESAASSAVSSATSAASSVVDSLSPAQLEDLSRSLYQRVRSRLAHDLRLERERSGLINHQSF